jgi:hypothetical protein
LLKMIRDQYVRDKFLLIKEAIKRIDKFKGDRKIASDLESYLVVLISGIYEDCLEYLINKRAAKAGDLEVAAFIEKTLDIQLRNPNWENLTNMLGRFSKKWVATMNKRIRNQAKTDLNNIVTNKNAVAHGNASNLTLGEIKNCHKNCRSIFEKLEKLM